ncbi:uncharacterized protein BP5553_05329 [Venustampulla echinocandica]|uniref:Uncharacterized protein n=1 Tax=Venustampulla echinocandica TaxID=2656787 RepID=A0A370TQT5_9HELO|nr:uncharacterized protein BP5553_05329 [Venustampulla echinocandica]RDL37896.1 hypothetical protein BP5553_05329 [Venustampulla echinocandica]
MDLFVSNGRSNELQPPRHDSIEEMANVLLDDTTADDLKPDLCEERSQIGRAMGAPTIVTQAAPANENTMPQSATLVFNGDGASLLNPPPTASVPCISDMIHDSTTSDKLGSAFPSVSTRPVSHARKYSASSMHRRAVKRKPLQRNRSISRPSKATSSPVDARYINGTIDTMLATTEVLKPTIDETVPQGSVVPARRRLRDSTVLGRMKSIMRDYLHATPHFEGHSISGPTVLDLGLSEGANFQNEQVPQIASHGAVRRNPVTSDTRSLSSRMSVGDLSSQGCSPTGQHGIPRLHRSLTDLAQFKERKYDSMGYQVNCDATFSSSPVAQSTPRIRLQPTIEEDESQDNTAVDAKFLSDSENSHKADYSDMDLDTEPASMVKSSTAIAVKRKGSQLGTPRGRLGSHSRTWKKHPSPSKSELERLEEELRCQYPNLGNPECVNDGDAVLRTPPAQFPTVPVLAAKDPNEGTKASKRLKNGKNFSLFKRSHHTRTTESTADINKGSKFPSLSLAPKLPRRFYSGYSKLEHTQPPNQEQETQDNAMADSEMEIDELQLNDPAFDIAMKP